MGVSATNVLTPDDLNRTDGAVLDVLHDGRVTPQYVADEIDVSRTYASERLKRLVEHSHVEKVAPGLYELVSDPRGDGVDDVDLEKVRAALREAKSAHADLRGDDLQEALDRALELLGEEVDDGR